MNPKELLQLVQPHLVDEKKLEVKKLDCSIKLNTTVSEFENSNGKQKFVSNLSISLGIDMSSIEIKSIR